MLKIIGLGNPGEKYIRTRHNVGHRVVNALRTCIHNNTGGAELALQVISTDTYMNDSGVFVRKCMQQQPNAALWVIIDDIEIMPGKVKWQYGGSARGHNGLRSINKLYGEDYGRIRFGVGRPTDGAQVCDYVLSPYSTEERDFMYEKEADLARFILKNRELLHACDVDSLRRHTIQ